MDAIDDKAGPVDLTTLTAGEATVRVLRGTLRYPPDHSAIARASRQLTHWQPRRLGAYRSRVLTDSQHECLAGAT